MIVSGSWVVLLDPSGRLPLTKSRGIRMRLQECFRYGDYNESKSKVILTSCPL